MLSLFNQILIPKAHGWQTFQAMCWNNLAPSAPKSEWLMWGSAAGASFPFSPHRGQATRHCTHLTSASPNPQLPSCGLGAASRWQGAVLEPGSWKLHPFCCCFCSAAQRWSGGMRREKWQKCSFLLAVNYAHTPVGGKVRWHKQHQQGHSWKLPGCGTVPQYLAPA